MPRKRNPDSSHADKALRLFAKLFFNPRAYSLTELSESLNCSKSTVKRVIEELEESIPTPITVRAEGPAALLLAAPPRTGTGRGADHRRRDPVARDVPGLRAGAPRTRRVRGRDERAREVHRAVHDSAPAVNDDTFSALSSGRVDYTPHEATLRTLLEAIAERRVCRITHRKLAADRRSASTGPSR